MGPRTKAFSDERAVTMSSRLARRTRDVICWWSFPQLRANLHTVIDLGLETLLDYQRLSMLLAALEETNAFDGDVIEFGTFRGGSAGVVLLNLGNGQTLHVCDSFEGMPETVAEDNFHKKGDFSHTGAGRVAYGLGKISGNFKMHKGFFRDTIPELVKENLTFSVAHIDADLYESVRESLEYCYPRMTTGGIVIFDDYGAPTCLGARKAIDEFFADKVEKIERLSGDQYGCVVGGGDVFSRLIGHFSLLSSSPRLASFVFPRH